MQAEIWVQGCRVQSASIIHRYNSDNVIIVISVYYYLIRQYAVLNLKQLNSNVQLHCTGSL